jgi:hypothetical protein
VALAHGVDQRREGQALACWCSGVHR